ncbi:ComEC/Rec2 family competence protein [Clostridium autoethanogenum]|uniref:ComEC/Rec2 family competence protein n=2 Tax=Clostridium autoethanogenum TaxID=84023 RepID=A0A3M0S5K7_9CLOT|nr:ComEC/Rec2 family competence protein [Clostridium autoethanogenum]
MKRPLVFYSISLALGSLSALVFLDNVFIAAVIAASFFIIMFYTLKIKFCILNAIFFIFGVVSFNMYFNIRPQDPSQIRVVEKKNYYFIGDYRGRKIMLKNKLDKLKEGESIKVYGNFKRELNAQKGIIGTYYIKKYETGKKDFIYSIYEFKRNIYERFKEVIGEERSALVMALCYGETSYISQDEMQKFQKLGVIHAVSVSGFHMAIIYQVLESIVGLKIAVIVSALYVFFTGMAAATMRSFIMIFLFKLSKKFFKEYDSISSLSLSALILIAVKPYYVVDLGFDLSFLATLGILLYNGKIYRKLFMLPQKLASSMSLTFSSQIFTLPYIAFTIQNFSWGFMIGNLFLLPLFSIIVVLGNAVLCICFVEPLFKLLCKAMEVIFTAIDGANMVVLKLCPEIIYLKYIDGLAFIAVFVSFLMYKKGYRKLRYLPIVCFILVFLGVYAPFMNITFINNDNGKAAIIKQGINKVMICSYDDFHSSWITNIKDDQYIGKVITNPVKNFTYIINSNAYLNIDNDMNSKLHVKNKEFQILFDDGNRNDIEVFSRNNCIFIPRIKSQNKNSTKKYENPLEGSTSYVIIFNMIFRIPTICD